MKNNDDILMEMLRKLDISISRAAVMIMLETGMLTEERLYTDYATAKNLAEVLENRDKYSREKTEYLLGRQLSPEQKAKVIEVWDEFFGRQDFLQFLK